MRPFTLGKLLSLGLILTILLGSIIGCGGEAVAPTATSEPTQAAKPAEATQPTATSRPTEPKSTETPKPTATFTPTQTPKPTDTAAPPTDTPTLTITLTPTPQPIPAEMLTQITTTYMIMIMAQMNTEMVAEMARRVASGELSGFDSLGAMIAVSAFIGAVLEAMPSKTPPAFWQPYWDEVEAIHSAVAGLVKRWWDKEIDSGEVLKQIGPLKESLVSALSAAEERLAQEYDVADARESAQVREEAMSAVQGIFPTTAPSEQPVATPDDLQSGGLGLSREAWEQAHAQSGTGPGPYINYDGGTYSITFVDGNLQHLERNYGADQPSLADARSAGALLIPADSQLVRSYSPEGLPELIVDLYLSESLKGRFESDVWIEGEPGNFIIVYGVFGGKVPRIVIGTGNNP